MSNFTTSWKFLEKLEAGAWARRAEARARLGQGEPEASWKPDAKPTRGELEPHDELEKFVKFYTSWKFA